MFEFEHSDYEKRLHKTMQPRGSIRKTCKLTHAC